MNNTENVYCRLCAELKPLKKLINLHTDDKKCQDIVNKLTRFNVHMNFNEDILPKVACLVCINSLDRAFDFVTAIEHAQSTLNDLILARQIKKEENVSEDSFVYESPFSQENDAEVKIESDSAHAIAKSTKLTESKKKKYICNSLDALPLSELKLSWKDYNWMCTYCETQFSNIDELKNHSMQYHKACNPYRCTDCNIRKLRLDSFVMHVKRHRKYLKFSCYKCPEKFTNAIQAAKHKSAHKDTNYICTGCNTGFSNEDELCKHISTFYRNTRRLPDTREVPILSQKDSLTCIICEKTCKTKSSLTTHLLIHTERKKTHTCEVCGKCFFQKGGLVEHMIQHTDARPFQCEICNSSFKTSRQLRQHEGIHNAEKPFACDQCGKCFRLKHQLTNHSIVHTDSLPHICTYCNKCFRFKTILNQHVRLHTGVKPYSCDICQRDFTNWPNYNKHMKRRHGTDMAKKKRIPDGPYPKDLATEEVKHTEADKMTKTKKKNIEQNGANAGRSRMNKNIGKLNVIDKESNNN